MSVTGRERVLAALAGEVTDRPPMTLWRHWPVDDQDAAAHARSAVAHHDSLGLDLLKITPSASFMSEAWGARTEYCGDVMGVRDYSFRPVAGPEDWLRLEAIDVTDAPSLSREVEVVRLLRDRLGPDVPLLPTVFTPLSVIRYLAGERFVADLRMHRSAVDRALDAVTRTTVDLVRALLGAGADGIYFSLFPASAAVLSLTEYREAVLPWDQAVMAAAEPAQMRVAHFHLPFPLLPLARELPVNVVSWEHTAEGGPGLAEGRELTGKAVIGGLDQHGALARGGPAEVAAGVRAAWAAGGAGLTLATSCSYPLTAPVGNLHTFADTVRSLPSA
ncbi:uroporphyrinogen decarboxylase family protein [Georgenia sp. M64]|uniref:uroporphyrinogen decarboxylase family protein n=1 Tax=Georgenia sp. M64 TaxID=3120520 RepID=UPI0030E03D41